MLFYFTATGNSLYVARELDDNPISIAQELRAEPKRYKAETIGIVTPVHYHEMPDAVKEFIRTSEFACDYFFIVGTYGNKHGGFAELTRRFLVECGKEAAYINTIIMVDTALPKYDIAEQLRIDPDKRVDEHIAALRADIESRRAYIQPVAQADLDHHFNAIAHGKIAPTDESPLYRVADMCNGCGTCVKVCPMNCIKLDHGRPAYRYARCVTCMACIHACPEKAIRFATLAEKTPGVHYRNPHVTLDDLVVANG